MTIAAGSLAVTPLISQLPAEFKVAGSLASLPIFYLGSPVRRRHYEDLELRKETLLFALERRTLNERAIYLPHLSPQRSSASGETKAILEVLEAKAHIELSALGVIDTFAFRRFQFDIEGLDNHTELFSAREFIRLAIACEGSPFFSLEQGILGVDIPKPQRDRKYPSITNPEWIGNSRQLILFAMGVDAHNRLRTIPAAADFGMMLVTGDTRSGKSQWLMCQLQFLIRRHTSQEIGVSIIEVKNAPSFRREDWEKYPHLVCPVANDHMAGLQVLLWHIEEGKRRGKLFRDASVDKLDEYNHQAIEPMPHLYVFIDEGLSYLDPNIAPGAFRALFIGMATEIATKFAGVGIHLILGVQRSGGSENDPFHGALSLRSNLSQRVALRVGTPQDALIALNTDEDSNEPLAHEAAHLLGYGDLIYRFQEHGGLVRVQGLKPDDPTNIIPTIEPLIDDELVEWEPLPAITEEIAAQYAPKLFNKKKQSPESAQNEGGMSHEEGMKLYQSYRALRQPTDGSKPLSMSKALQEIGGLGSDGGEAYIEWKNRLKKAVIANLNDWLSDLADLPDEEVLKLIWGTQAKDSNEMLGHIQKARK